MVFVILCSTVVKSILGTRVFYNTVKPLKKFYDVRVGSKPGIVPVDVANRSTERPLC
jgi:hypothetical protein